MNRRRRIFVIVPLILFILLAIWIKAEKSTDFESWVYEKVAAGMSPGRTVVMKAVSQLGNSTGVIGVCLALFILPKLRKRVAVPVSITVILSALTNVVLKHAFARNRPEILRLISETGYSFPSGHAMNNTALYVMLALLILKYVKNTVSKYVLAAICILIPIVIGYSRIYLGVHYAGDVIGGWLFGYGLSLLIFSQWEKRVLDKNGERLNG